MIRYTVTYAGRVQGVGFRATARRIAAGHRVLGWVRNESDGSVRMVVEGTGQEVERFLRGVRDAMGDRIDDVRIAKEPAHGEFKGFSIRY